MITTTKLTTAKLVLCTILLLTFIGCQNADIRPSYSTKYIQENKGKLTASVPEVYELGYTVLALTSTGQNDASVINTSSPYYQDLKAHFEKYKDHRAVKELDQKLTRFPGLVDDYLKGLFAYRMNDGRVVQRENYRIYLNKIEFSRYQLLLQDFYRATDFQKFYNEHKGTYDELIRNSNELVNLEKAKAMIGDADGYQIVLSPLAKGHAGKLMLRTEAYKECVVFPTVTTDEFTFGKGEKDVISKR